jgi:hypothetical protein
VTTNPEIIKNQLHSARRVIARLKDELRGLQVVAVAKRELHADIVALREDIDEIEAAAEAGSIRDVLRIVADIKERRERTREPRKVKADE